jgi:hypothetical protein
MKCDEFLPCLTTGSAFARFRARWHSRRCPHCAAVQERLAAMVRELDAAAPLTAYHRRVWEQAAVEPRTAAEASVDLSRRWTARPHLAVAGGLAIAAALLVAITLLVRPRNEKDQQIVERPQGIRTELLAVSPAEIAELGRGLDQVEADLKRLEEQAALLQARREIGELAAMYQPLVPNDSG